MGQMTLTGMKPHSALVTYIVMSLHNTQFLTNVISSVVEFLSYHIVKLSSIFSYCRISCLYYSYTYAEWRMGESQKISYMESWPSEKERKEGLRYKDTCKLDLQAICLNRLDWEDLAQNRPKWKQFVKAGLKAEEYKLRQDADSRRERRKQKTLQ
jgi:hypothetical protein